VCRLSAKGDTRRALLSPSRCAADSQLIWGRACFEVCLPGGVLNLGLRSWVFLSAARPCDGSASCEIA